MRIVTASLIEGEFDAAAKADDILSQGERNDELPFIFDRRRFAFRRSAVG